MSIRTRYSGSTLTAPNDIVSWLYTGDLQMAIPEQKKHGDFSSALIDEVNGHTLKSLAFLPEDNAVGPCPEHGILSKQSGPNKNGRKW